MIQRKRVGGSRSAASLLGSLIVASALALVLAAPASAAAPNWRLLGVTGPTNLPPRTSEIQKLVVDAEAGTYRLSYEAPGGEVSTTVELAVDAPAGAVQEALNALPGISGAGGFVRVGGGSGGPGGESPYYVRFDGALSGADVAQLAADAAGLSGAGHTVTVTTPTPGSPIGSGTLAVVGTNVGGAATSGVLTMRVDLPSGIVTGGRGYAVVGGENRYGTLWDCPAASGLSSVTCSYSQAVGSLKSLPGLVLPLAIEGGAVEANPRAAVSLTGGVTGTVPAADSEIPLPVSATPAAAGVQAMWAGAFDANGLPETQAGAHPHSALTAFARTTVLAADGRVIPAGDLKDVDVDLPPGFLANPLVLNRCPDAVPVPPDESAGASPLCNSSSIVGSLEIWSAIFGEGSALFNVHGAVPPPGYAAQFGTEIIINVQQRLVAGLRTDEDFGARVSAPNVVPARFLYGNVFSFQGFPAAAAGRPLLINPTSCATAAPLVAITNRTWQEQDVVGSISEAQPALTGCQALTDSWLGLGPEPKRPSFELTPTVTQGSSGTGAEARLHIEQEGIDEADKLATSALKKTVARLPQGLTLNPSAANGLETCSEAEIGLKGTSFAAPTPVRFTAAPPRCPDASKLGTVEATSPLLEAPVAGTIYLAAQEENPFGSLLAIYLAIESPRFGLNVKLAGEIAADPVSGQLTATFDDNPQLPVEDLTLHFRGGGPRSQLATPEVCGAYRSSGSLSPWSAEHGEAAPIDEPGFRIETGCAASAAARPFAPSFEAGTVDPRAGAHSPMVIRVGRRDGEQELSRLEFQLPRGLTGRLAGIPYCPDASIAAAASRSGRSELSAPSCSDAARLGSVDTGAGVGPQPIHVGGSLYLAGPYRGAPLSAVVITPAVAGPFDLGNVVVRAPLFVDPETAQISARSDQIPHILRGIPLKLRSVEIRVTRAGFTLNPTSCEPAAFGARMDGGSGASASSQTRFQVGGCDELPFRPGLKLRLFGKTNRNAKPRLKAVLTARPGDANIARAQVNLPHSTFLEQGHIRTICTRAQWAEGNGNGSACPSGSIYGRARAWTSLLDEPLEGPVYLRSSGEARELPDVVAALNGQISVALWGKVDSGPNRGLRNTFEVVPDAPVSRFVLEMFGGRKGLLVNSEDLCSPKAKRRAIVRFVGQNGKVRSFKPTVANRCGSKTARRASP